jgi:CBS domain containing-hemolysin-like protein
MEGVFVPLGFFATVVAIVYLRQRRRERLLLIEKGMDVKMLESTPASPLYTLKWGIVLVGLGIGMLIANALARTPHFKTEEAYFAMLFLFGGASLLIFHFIGKKQEIKNNRQ